MKSNTNADAKFMTGSLKDGMLIVRNFLEDCYFAQTYSGDSGAPVLDSNGRVIAIHTNGIKSKDSLFPKMGVGTSVEELNHLLQNLSAYRHHRHHQR